MADTTQTGTTPAAPSALDFLQVLSGIKAKQQAAQAKQQAAEVQTIQSGAKGLALNVGTILLGALFIVLGAWKIIKD